MLNFAKSAAQGGLRRLGYTIQKTQPNQHRFPEIDVFSHLARDLNSRRKGDVFVLQVGANDGVRADPVRPLVTEFPWHGLLIEPQPFVYQKLIENYAGYDRLQFADILISNNQESQATLFVPRAKLDEDRLRLTGLAGLERNSLVERMKQIGLGENDYTIEEITARSATLDDLLIERNVDRVDVLVIDAEGHDFNILTTLDFDRFKPSLIMMEFFHLSNAQQGECLQFLSDRGFRMTKVLGDLVAADFAERA
jgi:FkbM family methyltransferase